MKVNMNTESGVERRLSRCWYIATIAFLRVHISHLGHCQLLLGVTWFDIRRKGIWCIGLLHPADVGKELSNVAFCLSGETITYEGRPRRTTLKGRPWHGIRMISKLATSKSETLKRYKDQEPCLEFGICIGLPFLVAFFPNTQYSLPDDTATSCYAGQRRSKLQKRGRREDKQDRNRYAGIAYRGRFRVRCDCFYDIPLSESNTATGVLSGIWKYGMVYPHQ